MWTPIVVAVVCFLLSRFCFAMRDAAYSYRQIVSVEGKAGEADDADWTMRWFHRLGWLFLLACAGAVVWFCL